MTDYRHDVADEERVEVECRLIALSEDGLKIHVDGEFVWLPQSQCEWRDEDLGDVTIVEMPEWLALDRGLI